MVQTAAGVMRYRVGKMRGEGYVPLRSWWQRNEDAKKRFEFGGTGNAGRHFSKKTTKKNEGQPEEKRWAGLL